MLQQQERQIDAPACQPKLPFEQNLRLRRKIAIGLCCAALPVVLLFGYAAAKNTEMLKHLQTQAWEQVFLDTQAMPWVQKSVPEKQYAEALRLAHAGKTQEALVQAEQLTNLAEAKELAWMLRRYHTAEQATDLQQRHDQFGALGEFLDSAERKKETEIALLQAAWTALNTKEYWKAEEMFASIDIEEAEVGLTLAGAGRTLADAAAGGTQSQKALKKTLEVLRQAEQQGYEVSQICLQDSAAKSFLHGSWTAATGETLRVDCVANTILLEPAPEGDEFFFHRQGLEDALGALVAAWNYRSVDEIEITVSGTALVYFRDL